MDTPLIGTRPPDTSPPPRRPWMVPAIEDLGHMSDLTLQFGSEIDADCPPEDLFC